MIALIRVDDRLAHGQVMAVWARALKIDHLLVADDETAGDAFAQQVMQLAMPRGITLLVHTIAGAGPRLAAAAHDSHRWLVLLRDVASAIRLREAYAFDALNVGGVGMMPGRRLVWRSIALSPEEAAALRDLRAQGVDVYLQMLPSDPKKREW
ncbi:MAG: PTS sugar transporter subunit IIB [Candidatus Roseilinea sp.]|uniref:PTS sugar transporter subunit IIB n=1 Tax=Candidatus Roseilinea sp. TaxID=2838777 RepID=UPI00404B07C3